MKRKAIFRAMLDGKCPRCHRGDLFLTGALNLAGFHHMYKHCQVCKQTFEPEPGFYFGAMFVAYAMLVIMSVITWVTLYFSLHPRFAVYLGVILTLNVLFLPFIFRYSRILFLFGFGGIKFNNQFTNQ